MYILIGGISSGNFIQKLPIPKVYFLLIFQLVLLESFIVDSYMLILSTESPKNDAVL